MEIKFKGNIENSSIINRFNDKDTQLVGSQTILNQFDPLTDYIEYIIYDAGNNLLSIDYEFDSFQNGNNIEINPLTDLQKYFNVGEFITQYNFFKLCISNPQDSDLFIKEISSDRTELKLASLNITNLKEQTDKLIQDKNSVSYLKSYLLNFGNNKVKLITNIAWDSEGYILIKLYEPALNDINLNDTLYIVEEIASSNIFNINLSSEIIPDPLPNLKGPNFEVDIDIKNTISTKYESNNSLLSNYSGSSIQNILNQINLAEIEINVNYSSSFSNFVRFSSVEKRLTNFYNKVKQIEDYKNFITAYSSSTNPSILEQVNQYSSSINEITNKLDGYENYLYFETGSTPWPKITTTLPYILASTSSVSNWYSSSIDNCIYYDNNNPDKLINAIPEYILIDSNNEPYINFINMIGHYFDNIWIYIKSITDYYKSYNNLNDGISKDLVFFALQDLGIKLYNTKEDDNLYDYILGNNGAMPSQQMVAELYKRIYHNIPLLYKGKGSHKTLQELISLFGITGSILSVKEYGGDTNTNAALLDYSTNKVRLIDNEIYSASYGSILHPNIKLAVDNGIYENYKNDDSRIDVSFSPQQQLDLIISSSITTLNPNFNIDNYLGDPGYETSSSYYALDNLRNIAISSSFTSSYDLRGFIQLSQYFDNTLFKMIYDYIPAKSNLSEGIVIRSQALERIKWSRQLPQINNSQVYEAVYNTSSISNEYGNFYNQLEGNKSSYYTGEISGSEQDIYNIYFEPNNFNNYALTGSNTSLFRHSDYNVTLNNISSSTLSSNKRKYEKNPFSTSSILTPVEVQDSNYYDSSWVNSRYKGNRLNGAYYNIFTKGDISYDNNPVIRHLDSCIYEVEWGGGGYPENENGGGIRLGNIYVVGETKDDIIRLYPNDPTYYNILEKNIKNFQNVILNQYSGNSLIPSNLTISYSNLGLPNASYYISSGYVDKGTGGYYGILYPTGSSTLSINEPCIYIQGAQSILTPLAELNQVGYIQESTATIQTNYLLDGINNGINNGEKWFISLYSGSGGTGSLSMISGLPQTATGSYLTQYGHSFEIDRIVALAPNEDAIVLKNNPNNSVKYWFETGSSYKNGTGVFIGASGSLNVSNTGMLLIKADYPNNSLVIFGYPGYNFSSVGKGYITLPYKKDIITNNIKYIINNHVINPT